MAIDFDEKTALKLCINKDTPAGVLKTLVGNTRSQLMRNASV